MAAGAVAEPANQYSYLDESDPYYVSRHFPKLITPQWIGEAGVEAVIVLSIDDMREHGKYEEYLRPILERLKQIDGRAPVSILSCTPVPDEPHLQQWRDEGLSLEVHTLRHPCPMLAKNDFADSQDNYHGCVDLLNAIPANRPVAFRMPCCDSLNTPSPRFFSEIFNAVSPAGNFLEIDSSVFNITTAKDSALPREIVLREDGSERFRDLIPFDSFVNTIEDYPYPYVIGKRCWEIPCTVPSDWEGQKLHGVNSPETVADMKAAIDAAVLKQGVYTLVFHPHGWIRNDQVIELIEHAVARHGNRVKFLNFREVADRLNANLLDNQPLRNAAGGGNGVRLIDVDRDGYLDVVIGNMNLRATRVWSPDTRTWNTTGFPATLAELGQEGDTVESGVRFGAGEAWQGHCVALWRTEDTEGAWAFVDGAWTARPKLLQGLEVDGVPVQTRRGGVDHGVRLRDLDHDGTCELVAANAELNAVFRWDIGAEAWRQAAYALPRSTRIVDSEGRDAGLRFIDLDADGDEDIVYSNGEACGVFLFTAPDMGWTEERLWSERSEEPGAIPPMVRAGGNAGAWFHSGQLWFSNEATDTLPDHVNRVAVERLLAGMR